MSPDFSTPSAVPSAGFSRGELRAALRRRRDTVDRRESRAAALDAALERELRALRGTPWIGAYCASRGEYDALRVLLRVGEALGWPWSVALPVVRRSERLMQFFAWAPGQALCPGAYGIDEPAPGGAAVEPEVLLVPCLGFVADGLRLGYGGGYYDRYLAHRPGVLTIGLGFDACRLDGLQAQPHDRRLSVILTESARYAPSPRGVPATA